MLNNHDHGAMLSFSRLLGTGKASRCPARGNLILGLCSGFGAEGVEVTRSGDIYPALRQALTNEGPSVIDIQIDPDFGETY